MWAMSENTHDIIDQQFDRAFSGEAFDWKGATIPAARLRDRLFGVPGESRQTAITIHNARIEGDLILDELGECSEPLSLQLIDCRLGVFRARASRWRQLLIAKSRLKKIDMAQSIVDRSFSIELCRLTEGIQLHDCQIGGNLALNGSRFASVGANDALVLTNASIGRDLTALNISSRGPFKADRVAIGGNALFDGAEIDGRRGEGTPRALDLSRARIGGMVQFAPGDGRFIARGRVHVDAAELGSLVVKAAMLDGCGQPAIVGDQVHIRETLDMSGLSDAEDDDPLEVKGAMRFGSSTIGRQFQLSDALLEADGDCLILYNCQVGGDLLIGNDGATTQFKGALNANTCAVAGRLILLSLEIDRPAGAISVRQARIAKEVTCANIKANGCIDFGNLEAAGIEFDNIELARGALPPVRPGLPEAYSQPEDVLLDLPFVQIRGDLRVENLELRNGTFRLMGAEINRGVQLSRIAIDCTGRLALVAQNAKIGTSFYVAGTPSVSAVFDGDVSMLGAQIAGDVSFLNVRIGTAENPAKFEMHNSIVDSSLLLNECECHGPVIVSGMRIGGDLFFHSTNLHNPGKVCCDVRSARIAGKLQWATTRRVDGEIAITVEGLVTADGAIVGSLGWHHVRLADHTALDFTNMKIERRIDADTLSCEDLTRIDLSGTTVPLLIDRFGARDSWGKARLGLDNFIYDQLANPSGGNGDEAGEIVKHRSAWLHRRIDPTSARPARHLAVVLRQQGLFEASRRVLMTAFDAEGIARPTWAGRHLAHVFGVWFGHGLSGARAALAILFIWTVGVSGTFELKNRDLLVAASEAKDGKALPCKELDPYIYPLDVMVPLDLGEESRCRIAVGEKADPRLGYDVGVMTLGATVPTAKAAAVFYKLLAWIALSLAIATWSGLFKRSGRE